MAERDDGGISRRVFLQTTAMAALGAACRRDGAPAGPQAGPVTRFSGPSRTLSGDLGILLWSHFVPQHDRWFDPFAKQWGQRVGVNVTVNHINPTGIPGRISAEITAGQGHDLIQYLSPLPQFESSVIDMTEITQEAVQRHGQQLELCRKSSFNPTTNRFFAYCPGWVPKPGQYRKSLWKRAGFPDGPSTFDELLVGGSQINDRFGVRMGIGMSNERDSNLAGLALLWSFGGAVQDEREQVVINSDETVVAVEFMRRLFEQAMTDEVFAWTTASNNRGLIAGQLSYILNAISAYRTTQTANPDVAADVFFTPALTGPAAQLVGAHVVYNWIIPRHARNVDAAMEFLLHYTANFEQATYHSQLYDLPAFGELVPQLGHWFRNDPFGSKPVDKLAVLTGAMNWSAHIGHPGASNAAIGEVFDGSILPTMFAQAARGQRSPKEAVADAESRIQLVFDRWRREGMIGGGSG